MKALASYVEQSDALLGVLSVQETLYFSARLRYVLYTLSARSKLLSQQPRPSLDPTTPEDVIHARVAETIADLGLTDVANNRIGTAIQRGVSGGQKRRVTIGASLVSLPRILFLDEPTSGLDSRTSAEVLSASMFLSLGYRSIGEGLTAVFSQELRSETRRRGRRQHPPAQLGDVRAFRQAPAPRSRTASVLRPHRWVYARHLWRVLGSYTTLS